MPELILNGCAPVPLAHYLKALGILRIVAEQLDARVKACWRHDALQLNTDFTLEDFVRFFLEQYRPTPVLAPWNGGSGFFANDNHAALIAIAEGTTARLALYRDSIAAARRELKALGLEAKPEDKEVKARLISACRRELPDAFLDWLDAVVVLAPDGPDFPPLLGTGGNDGRLEFANNFMQRITDVIDPSTGEPGPQSEHWLRAALFGKAALGVAMKAPVGQFFPGAAGGANATAGFDGQAAVNPWDFILMIEGAMLFAAASVKRLESRAEGSLLYPFCVRQVGVGYASAAAADEADARCEMWMPLWSRATTLPELRAILGEGRAQVRGRPARTGVDFAEAAVTLGVDRGIGSFQRYGFQVRNGLSYFATPLERIPVKRNTRADLLADVEQWHDRLRQKAGPRANPAPPASVIRALNQLERRILELCREDRPSRLLAVLVALGAVERALARSFKWATEACLRPLHGLRPEWLAKADDGSVEFRLAGSLAAMRARLGKETLWFRQHLEPLERLEHGGWFKPAWSERSAEKDATWHDGELTEALNASLARRLVRVAQSGAEGWPDWSPRPAGLADITAFIERRTNDELLADLIWGLSLVDWARVSDERNADAADGAVPSSFYALLRLCFRRAQKGREQDAIPLVPDILLRAMSGDGKAASELAARRLRASGQAPLVASLPVTGDVARRTAAAMLFPIGSQDFFLLEKQILRPQQGAE